MSLPIWTVNFCILCLTNLLLFMSIQILLPTLPLYITNIGGNQKDVGYVMGAFTIGAMAVRPMAGLLIDRLGRRKILLAGTALMVVLPLLYHFAAAVLLLLLVRLAHGISYSISTTATGTIVADILPRSRLGEGMGYFGLTSSLSMALAPLLGLWILQVSNYFWLFVTVSLLAVITFLLSLYIGCPQEQEPGAKQEIAVSKFSWAGFFEKSALPSAWVIFFLATVFGAVIAFIALHGAEKGISNIGLFFTANAVAMMISRPLSGRWCDKHGAVMIVLVGHLLTIISMAAIAFSHSVPSFVLAGLAYGLGFGFCLPALQALAVRNAPAQRRGAATGTFFTAFDLGIGLGTILWGFVASLAGYQTMFLSTIVPVAIAGLLFFIFNKNNA